MLGNKGFPEEARRVTRKLEGEEEEGGVNEDIFYPVNCCRFNWIHFRRFLFRKLCLFSPTPPNLFLSFPLSRTPVILPSSPGLGKPFFSTRFLSAGLQAKIICSRPTFLVVFSLNLLRSLKYFRGKIFPRSKIRIGSIEKDRASCKGKYRQRAVPILKSSWQIEYRSEVKFENRSFTYNLILTIIKSSYETILKISIVSAINTSNLIVVDTSIEYSKF